MKYFASIKKLATTTVAAGVLTTFAASAGWAQETLPPNSSIAVASLGTAIVFDLDLAHEKAWIEVSGTDDFHIRRAYGADQALVIESAALVDGHYTWEVLAVAPRQGDDRPRRGEAGLETPSARTFSGTFRVLGGAVALPAADGPSESTQKTASLQDDLAIQGNACVGQPCTISEVFGFDTLRVKELNPRLHFDDTSTSQHFPQNDWRLVANDSVAMGSNFFAIEDVTGSRFPFRVEAGARDHALYVQADGDVGFGTSTPAVDLHVSTGNSPTIRLEQDGSEFNEQIWDIKGNEYAFSVSEGHFGPRPLVIEAGSGTGSLRINDEGWIGLHNEAPKAPLHVLAGGTSHTPSNPATVAVFQNNAEEDDGSIVSILAGDGSANAQLWFGDADDDNAGRVIYRNGTDAMSFWTAGSERLYTDSDGDVCFGCNNTEETALRHVNGAYLSFGGTWTNASSRTLKQDIASLSTADALDALAELEPVTFRYRAEQDETYVGFIAEDVPELVAMSDRRSLTSMDVVAVLTKVLQEQQRLVQEQQAAIAELRTQTQK